MNTRYTYLFVVVSLIFSHSCGAMEAEKTLSELPAGVKPLILSYCGEEGTYAEIGRRLRDLRCVSQEWNKLLQEESLIYDHFFHTSDLGDQQVGNILRPPLARYLAKLLTSPALAPERKRALMVVGSNPQDVAVELFCEVLPYIDRWTAEEACLALPLLADLLSREVNQLQVRRTGMAYGKVITKLVDFCNASPAHRSLALTTFEQVFPEGVNGNCHPDMSEILILWYASQKEHAQEELTINERELSYNTFTKKFKVQPLSDREAPDLAARAQAIGTFKNLSAQELCDQLIEFFSLSHAERSLLKDCLTGNSTSLKENYVSPKNPLIIDCALLLVLKAGHDECVPLLLEKEVSGACFSLRPLDAAVKMLVAQQAVTRTEDVCLAIAGFYAAGLETDMRVRGTIFFELFINCTSEEEIQRGIAFIKTFAHGTPLASAPFELLTACMQQQEYQVCELLTNLGQVNNAGQQKLNMIFANVAVQMSIMNRLHNTLIAMTGSKLGNMLIAHPEFQSFRAVDDIFAQLSSTFSPELVAMVFYQVYLSTHPSEVTNLATVKKFLDRLNLWHEFAQVIEAFEQGDTESVALRTRDPLFWDLACLATYVLQHDRALHMLLTTMPSLQKNDDSESAKMRAELLLWQIKVAFTLSKKDCIDVLLAKSKFHLFRYEALAESLIMDQVQNVDDLIFVCTRLFSHDNVLQNVGIRPECPLCAEGTAVDTMRLWLIACWNEDEQQIKELFPLWFSEHYFPRVYEVLAQWAAKTGRLSFLKVLFEVGESINLLQLNGLSKELREVAQRYEQTAVLEFLHEPQGSRF